MPEVTSDPEVVDRLRDWIKDARARLVAASGREAWFREAADLKTTAVAALSAFDVMIAGHGARPRPAVDGVPLACKCGGSWPCSVVVQVVADSGLLT